MGKLESGKVAAPREILAQEVPDLGKHVQGTTIPILAHDQIPSVLPRFREPIEKLGDE